VKLPKKGNLTATAAGITLSSSPSKLFTRVLLNRLQKMLWMSKQATRKVTGVHNVTDFCFTQSINQSINLLAQIKTHKIDSDGDIVLNGQKGSVCTYRCPQ